MAGRRQVLSYSDSFAAPSGDVDFEQPLPSLAASQFDSSQHPMAGPSSSRSQRRQREVPRQPPPPHAPPTPLPTPPMSHPSHSDAMWGPPRDSTAYLPPPPQAGPFHPTHPMIHHGRPPLPYGHGSSPFAPPGPSQPIPYYTGPPPGFGPPPVPSLAHIPDERFAAPRLPSTATGTLPTGPRADRIASGQQDASLGGPHSAPFLASPMAYHDTIIRSTPFSQVHYNNRPSFVWPGSNYYERTKVVIEDWDLSSDEEEEEEELEEGEHRDEPSTSSTCQMTARERRCLARATRRIHDRNVQELFDKVTGKVASSATTTPPTQEGTSAQPTAPVEQAAKENTLLEKKQLEIKAMMERIKKLEAGRSSKVKPNALAAPVVTTSSSPIADTTANGQQAGVEKAQEPSVTKPILTIDPSLAEQRRKLLEAMSARSKKLASASGTTSAATSSTSTPGDGTPTGVQFILDTTPSIPATSKRKADNPEADDEAESAEAATVTQDENSNAPTDLTGRKAKRQRKKERRRAEARAREELDGKLHPSEIAEQTSNPSAEPIVESSSNVPTTQSDEGGRETSKKQKSSKRSKKTPIQVEEQVGDGGGEE